MMRDPEKLISVLTECITRRRGPRTSPGNLAPHQAPRGPCITCD